jgi:hypothetical protein
MQRSAARTKTRTMLGEPTARFFTDSDLNGWIDDGVRDIAIKTFCLQGYGTAFETTNGTKEYAYPVLLNNTAVVTLGIKTVINSNGTSLNYIDPDLIGRVDDDPDKMKWTEWDDKIIFTPTPTATYTMIPLFWHVTGCTADSTEFEIKDAYHHLVPIYAAGQGFYKRRNFAAGEAYLKSYNIELQVIANTIGNKFTPVSNKNSIKDQSPVD